MRCGFESAIVLGASGFIGRHLTRILEDRGVRVHAIPRAEGDLSDWPTAERLLREAPRAERIFHLATRQRTGAIQYAIQSELLALNARMHLNVIEAWRRHQPQAKFVSTGSSCVYPESGQPLPEERFQAGPLHPSVQGYGLAKQILAIGSEAAAREQGLSYLHLILATVYGPGDHTAPDRSHFMGGMIARARAEHGAGARRFTVWGGPDTVRDLLYVEDQIAAMLVADAAFENRILNCSANRPVRIGDCAEAIRRALDWDAAITYPPESFSGTPFKSIDAGLFLAATGWKPHVALDEGIARILKTEG